MNRPKEDFRVWSLTVTHLYFVTLWLGSPRKLIDAGILALTLVYLCDFGCWLGSANLPSNSDYFLSKSVSIGVHFAGGGEALVFKGGHDASTRGKKKK